MIPMLRLFYVISKQAFRFLLLDDWLALEVDVVGIWAAKPALCAGVIPCPEVIQPRFNIPLLEG
jgi:hypothetical protein